MKRFLIFFGVILFAINALILVSGYQYLYKAIWYNLPGIEDYKIFENRKIQKSKQPQEWPLSRNYNKIELTEQLSTVLEELETVAFLVIQNDSVLIEHYWDGYSDSSKSNSFSMAKSYVSTLIGFAITDGFIESVEDPVGKYIPEFKNDPKGEIKIREVLQMSSGLSWNESYAGPFSITTKAYYGKDIRPLISGLKIIEKPGERFKYLSGDTQLLAWVVEEATGKTISDYMQEKMWQPMGYQQDALWCLDHKGGVEKAYCCINSNARDFARIIKLYLNKGKWKGEQLLDSNYAKRAVSENKYTEEGFDDYGFQWWRMGDSVFYARGILGQYAMGIPSENTIIVRLGHKRGEKIGAHPKEVYIFVEEVLKMLPEKDD